MLNSDAGTFLQAMIYPPDLTALLTAEFGGYGGDVNPLFLCRHLGCWIPLHVKSLTIPP